MKLEKMRLKISFLQKTPVWVFFCFLTVVFLLAPIESHATTQIPSLGYMDDITNAFNTELQRWGGETFKNAADTLRSPSVIGTSYKKNTKTLKNNNDNIDKTLYVYGVE